MPFVRSGGGGGGGGISGGHSSGGSAPTMQQSQTAGLMDPTAANCRFAEVFVRFADSQDYGMHPAQSFAEHPAAEEGTICPADVANAQTRLQLHQVVNALAALGTFQKPEDLSAADQRLMMKLWGELAPGGDGACGYEDFARVARGLEEGQLQTTAIRQHSSAASLPSAAGTFDSKLGTTPPMNSPQDAQSSLRPDVQSMAKSTEDVARERRRRRGWGTSRPPSFAAAASSSDSSQLDGEHDVLKDSAFEGLSLGNTGRDSADPTRPPGSPATPAGTFKSQPSMSGPATPATGSLSLPGGASGASLPSESASRGGVFASHPVSAPRSHPGEAPPHHRIPTAPASASTASFRYPPSPNATARSNFAGNIAGFASVPMADTSAVRQVPPAPHTHSGHSGSAFGGWPPRGSQDNTATASQSQATTSTTARSHNANRPPMTVSTDGPNPPASATTRLGQRSSLQWSPGAPIHTPPITPRGSLLNPASGVGAVHGGGDDERDDYDADLMEAIQPPSTVAADDMHIAMNSASHVDVSVSPLSTQTNAAGPVGVLSAVASTIPAGDPDVGDVAAPLSAVRAHHAASRARRPSGASSNSGMQTTLQNEAAVDAWFAGGGAGSGWAHGPKSVPNAAPTHSMRSVGAFPARGPKSQPLPLHPMYSVDTAPMSQTSTLPHAQVSSDQTLLRGPHALPVSSPSVTFAQGDLDALEKPFPYHVLQAPPPVSPRSGILKPASIVAPMPHAPPNVLVDTPPDSAGDTQTMDSVHDQLAAVAQEVTSEPSDGAGMAGPMSGPYSAVLGQPVSRGVPQAQAASASHMNMPPSAVGNHKSAASLPPLAMSPSFAASSLPPNASLASDTRSRVSATSAAAHPSKAAAPLPPQPVFETPASAPAKPHQPQHRSQTLSEISSMSTAVAVDASYPKQPPSDVKSVRHEQLMRAISEGEQELERMRSEAALIEYESGAVATPRAPPQTPVAVGGLGNGRGQGEQGFSDAEVNRYPLMLRQTTSANTLEGQDLDVTAPGGVPLSQEGAQVQGAPVMCANRRIARRYDTKMSPRSGIAVKPMASGDRITPHNTQVVYGDGSHVVVSAQMHTQTSPPPLTEYSGAGGVVAISHAAGELSPTAGTQADLTNVKYIVVDRNDPGAPVWDHMRSGEPEGPVGASADMAHQHHTEAYASAVGNGVASYGSPVHVTAIPLAPASPTSAFLSPQEETSRVPALQLGDGRDQPLLAAADEGPGEAANHRNLSPVRPRAVPMPTTPTAGTISTLKATVPAEPVPAAPVAITATPASAALTVTTPGAVYGSAMPSMSVGVAPSTSVPGVAAPAAPASYVSVPPPPPPPVITPGAPASYASQPPPPMQMPSQSQRSATQPIELVMRTPAGDSQVMLFDLSNAVALSAAKASRKPSTVSRMSAARLAAAADANLGGRTMPSSPRAGHIAASHSAPAAAPVAHASAWSQPSAPRSAIPVLNEPSSYVPAPPMVTPAHGMLNPASGSQPPPALPFSTSQARDAWISRGLPPAPGSSSRPPPPPGGYWVH